MKKLSKNKSMFIALIFFITIVFAIISITIGYYTLSLNDIINAILGKEVLDKNSYSIIFNIRLPRIISAILIGASLSVSGATYQGMFKNPLVSPDILGVSAGASAGAALAIVLGYGAMMIQIYAFVFGFLAVCLSYTISLKSKHSKTLSLVLTGTMIGSLCSAFVTLIKYLANPSDALAEITFWLMGSLSKVTMSNVLISIFPMTLGFIIIFLYRWKLNLLMLSDHEAKSMGINPKKIRFILIIASTLMSASAVCLGGLIGWVGLIIPHIVRFIFGANYKYVIPASCGLGALFLLIIDTIARSTFSIEIPLGVLTAFCGTPFFLSLILFKSNPIIEN